MCPTAGLKEWEIFAPTGFLYADRFFEFIYKKPHMTLYTFKGAVYYCMWKYQ